MSEEEGTNHNKRRTSSSDGEEAMINAAAAASQLCQNERSSSSFRAPPPSREGPGWDHYSSGTAKPTKELVVIDIKRNGNAVGDDDSLTRDESGRVKVESRGFCQTLFSGGLISCIDRMLQRTCFRSMYSLRFQLFGSFGIVTTLGILVVMITSILTAIRSGSGIKSVAESNFELWATSKVGQSTRYVADTVTAKLNNFAGMAHILKLTTQDRFRGYPNAPGYEEDLLVPFVDLNTGEPRYPWAASNSSRLDFAWNNIAQVNASNAQEHVQERYPSYTADGFVGNTLGTAQPALHFQGACNPSATLQNGLHGYVADCTPENNNNLTTGGKVAPTSTFASIFKKSNDFALYVMKPLYEYHIDVYAMGLHFANDGAGATVSFPTRVFNRKPANRSVIPRYRSIGCDWMNTTNPLNASKVLGTREQIANCHPKDSLVPIREFNPLERDWCRQQALFPEQFHSVGPYYDASNPNLLLLTFGQAIYDTKTQEFIACTLADVRVDRFNDIIKDFTVTNTSYVALVRWERGTVIASDAWDTTKQTGIPNITELDLGVSDETFQQMKDKFLANWNSETWKSATTANSPYDPSFKTSNHVVAGYPVPVPPSDYDPNYYRKGEPEFMVIVSVPLNDIYKVVKVLEKKAERSIERIILHSILSGVVGWIILILLIALMSLYLTFPLQWMNEVGDQIVDTVGSHNRQIQYQETIWFKLSPRTEVWYLVREFQNMLNKFSGTGTAKLYKQRGMECKNPFGLNRTFSKLYHRRSQRGFRHSYVRVIHMLENPEDIQREEEEMKAAEKNGSGSANQSASGGHRRRSSGLSPQQQYRKHWGPNFRHAADGDSTMESTFRQSSITGATAERKMTRSRLFWWILGCITIPLLIVSLVVASLVIFNLSKYLPRLVDDIENDWVGFEEFALSAAVRTRAFFASEVISSYIRDLHLLYRVFGWILFGAIERSDTFTTMLSYSDHCKNFASPKACKIEPPEHDFCDCAWNDIFKSIPGKKCTDAKALGLDSRDFQFLRFSVQNDDTDTDPINGNRHSSRLPAAFPNETSWVTNIDAVPGVNGTSNAEGIASTTFDRLRLAAATSVVSIPLVHYDNEANFYASSGTFFGFERDGMLVSHAGCFNYDKTSAHAQIDDTVGTNSTICRPGKYGYDCRCRGWYQRGKETALEAGQDGDLLFITPPFNFSGLDAFVGSTSTISYMDPDTNEYIGQAASDVDTTLVIDRLSHEETPLFEGGFHVLITTKRDADGFDTVVGPGFTLGEDFGAIEDIIFEGCEGKSGSGNCQARDDFVATTLKGMQNGAINTSQFDRVTEQGTERVFLAYAPVEVLSFRAVDHSDISRGVTSFRSTPYSMALAETTTGLKTSFDSIESKLNRAVLVGILCQAAVMFVTFVVVFLISVRVARSIVVPVRQLLVLVRNINKCEIHEDLPQVMGGSLEVSKVRDSFEKLYMVVRFANLAFFSGDLTKAYAALKDALELFTKLNNSKAIGVANNNLGNTMLTMYRAMENTKAPTICGMTKETIIENGIKYFKAAIDSGEEAIARINAKEGWSTNYLVYMQQLSNRYFNRAIFLLTVKNDHPDPEEAERQGFIDLATAKDMDREVVDNGEQQGFKGDYDVYFDLLLSRITGVLTLIHRGYEDEWGLSELFDDARRELVNALGDPDNILFRDMEPPAQMQRLDAVMIMYYLRSSEPSKHKAAEVAIRMLVEDDYVIGDAALIALKALIVYTDELSASDLKGEDPSDVKATMFQYRRRIIEMQSLVVQDTHDIIGKECFKLSNLGDFFMEEF